MPNSDNSPHFVEKDLLDKGARLGQQMLDAVGEWQLAMPRTALGDGGGLGFSDLGACRELIRSKVTNAPRRPPKKPLKWAAALGTWSGDGIEVATKWKYGDAVITQRKLRLDLGEGIIVSGSSDCIWVDENAVVDLKSKDGLETVRREGPSLKEWIQISGYLVAGIQMKLVTKDAIATLVYFDRSGKDKTVHTATIDFELALQYLDVARQRLHDVEVAIDQGIVQSYLRDEPESWCFNVGCPFYEACWEGYTPTDEIGELETVLVDRFVRARDDAKAATAAREEARNALKGQGADGTTHYVKGLTKTHSVNWSLRESQYGNVSETLNVRER